MRIKRAIGFWPTWKGAPAKAAAVGAVLAILAGVSPAAAELIVTNAAKAPGVEKGTTLPDEHVFDLPQDAELRLTRSPSGAQFEMRGPFKGTLEAFIQDCTGWLAFTRPHCQKPSGDNLPVGGTRGVRLPSE